MTTLASSSQSMGSAMYANADEGPGAASAGAGSESAADEDEGIVDAEIVDEGSSDAADDSEEGKQ